MDRDEMIRWAHDRWEAERSERLTVICEDEAGLAVLQCGDGEDYRLVHISSGSDGVLRLRGIDGWANVGAEYSVPGARYVAPDSLTRQAALGRYRRRIAARQREQAAYIREQIALGNLRTEG
ncbi:MAG: hypothetical protein FD176_169 [Rhodospirillaceae bacterium]|nr:MAG: hypothetical protein FD176_169 [Rhodospirillaceae bacterium]TNC98687.1 MAG: hypothetical protein FD119_158 [Stygiobacter sp.]